MVRLLSSPFSISFNKVVARRVMAWMSESSMPERPWQTLVARLESEGAVEGFSEGDCSGAAAACEERAGTEGASQGFSEGDGSGAAAACGERAGTEGASEGFSEGDGSGAAAACVEEAEDASEGFPGFSDFSVFSGFPGFSDFSMFSASFAFSVFSFCSFMVDCFLIRLQR